MNVQGLKDLLRKMLDASNLHANGKTSQGVLDAKTITDSEKKLAQENIQIILAMLDKIRQDGEEITGQSAIEDDSYGEELSEDEIEEPLEETKQVN